MPKTYSHLTRYTKPANFADFSDIDRSQYFVAAGQHRDSDTLTRSNFRSTLDRLGGESETVLVLRDNHWAVGWVEAIYIHESDTKACETADRILSRLEDYPVVSEDDWFELEYTEAAEYWARMSVAERLYWCQKYDVSPFAARRAEVPDDPRGELVSALVSN
jgi:hypothetical protein